VDDILDVTGTDAELGKPCGSDIKNEKSTFVALLGIEASRARAAVLIREAQDALARFGARARPLSAIAEFIEKRKH